jgi:branched-chain amino acid transport system permease protein
VVGSGSKRGAVLGAIVVWAIWVGSGTLTAAIVPGDLQARAASLQIVAIGVMLCMILLWRPQGFFGPKRRKT